MGNLAWIDPMELKELRTTLAAAQERLAELEADLDKAMQDRINLYQLWERQVDNNLEEKVRAEKAEARAERLQEDASLGAEELARTIDEKNKMQAVVEAAEDEHFNCSSDACRVCQALDAAKRPAPRNPEGEEDPR